VIEGSKPVRGNRKRLVRIVQVGVSLIIAAGIFVGVLPKIADYSAVGATISGLSWFELLTLVGAAAFATAAFWPQLTASLPGLSVAQAGIANQVSTTVANTVPGGGVVAVGVSYAMFRSWGFADTEVGLSVLVTFVWNTFMKLALPVAALLLLATTGKGSAGLIAAAVVGLVVLLGAIAAFAVMHRREGLPGQIGSVVGTVASFFRRLVRKPPVTGWGENAVRLRTDARRLVLAKWIPLTISTVVSHLAVFLVLALAVRDVGISAREVTWAQILGVFAVVRLLSALPITPGGLGIVDLGYIGGLVLAGRHHAGVPLAEFRAQVTAAVLVFRALTYGLQIPLGAVAYLIWQRKKSWRRSSLQEGAVERPAEATAPLGDVST
jgi:putative heme transporter